MALQPANTQTSNEVALALVRKQAIDGVVEMFNRAIEHSPELPDIQDDKDEIKDNKLPRSGPLQDCEFGLTLLLIRDWLGDALFENIDKATFEKVVIALVKRTINRILSKNQSDKGGRGNHAVFFTGEPYTEYDRGASYSANLDAAMITLAFLSPALMQFNEELVKLDRGIQPKSVLLPDWVESLRDVALYIIVEGLKYAQECRVNNEGFLGFTCDPESNAARPVDGFLNNEDRLFFTWTACETINDMIEWRELYLHKGHSAPPPSQAVTELDVLIDDLNKSLRESAQWCEGSFFEQFKAFEPRDTKDLVKDINKLGSDTALDDELEERVNRMTPSVQYVYHLSQYAAIRSLVPESITIDEARIIIDKLDLLVSRSIIASGLDEAEHPKLYRSLTRKYSLGKSSTETYRDDAWYPLVVRSLSGLLARTLIDFQRRQAWKEVLELTLKFQRSLEGHVKNLLDRRPRGGEDGPDGKLWSFAEDQPYVLYATQRTIFALMKYEEFLLVVDEFQRAGPEDDSQGVKPEDDLSLLLSRKLAEAVFWPVVKEVLSQIPASQVGASFLHGNNELNGLLPDEPWAAKVIHDWLAEFTRDFKRLQVAANLTQKSHSLKLIRKYAENYQPSENLERRKREGAERHLGTLKQEYETIRNNDQIGKQLSQLTTWEDGELTAILFEYLFRNYLKQPGASLEDMLNDDKTELWKLIQDAIGTQDAITKNDPTATVL
jgi:hypothetical protein